MHFLLGVAMLWASSILTDLHCLSRTWINVPWENTPSFQLTTPRCQPPGCVHATVNYSQIVVKCQISRPSIRAAGLGLLSGFLHCFFG